MHMTQLMHTPIFNKSYKSGTWARKHGHHGLFNHDLPEVVAQACPSGAHIAFKVWHFFRTMKCRDPSAPKLAGDFGITWCELACLACIVRFLGCQDPKTRST